MAAEASDDLDPRQINTVRLPQHDSRDGKVFFAIDVRLKDTEPFRIWKRYNQFAHLKDRCAAADSGARAAENFPKKSVAKLGADSLALRRRELDEWLAAMISRCRSDEGAALRPLLSRFLDPAQRVAARGTAVFDPSDDTPSIAAVRLAAHEDRDGTVFYAIDVTPETGTHPPFRLYKSYSMFAHLCGVLSSRGWGEATADFPAKSVRKLAGEEVEARRKKLDFWLSAAVERSREDAGRPLRGALKQFLDPNEWLDSGSDDDSPPGSPTAGSPAEEEHEPLGITAVRLCGFEERGRTTFYSVDVRDADGATFRLWKRYDQFANLCSRCVQADPQASVRSDFPGKTLGKADADARRRQLDFWLTAVFDRAQSPEGAALRQPLRRFLDPAQAQSVGAALAAASGGEFGVGAVSMPSHEDRDGTAFYRIDVTPTSGEPFVVWKSYSMFSELMGRCRAAVGPSFDGGKFPGKTLLRLGPEGLQARHKALSDWFSGMVERAKGDDYPMLRPVLREFLDPAHG